MIPLWLGYDTVWANPSFSIALFIFVVTGAKSLDWEELFQKRMYSHISHQGPDQVIASNDLLKCVFFLFFFVLAASVTLLLIMTVCVQLWNPKLCIQFSFIAVLKKRFVDDDECFPSLETRDSVHNQIKVWTRLPFISIFTVSNVFK